jgi:hypothetical protein
MGGERLTEQTAGGNMRASRSGQAPCVLLSVVDCSQTTTRHICGPRLSAHGLLTGTCTADAGAALRSGEV